MQDQVLPKFGGKGEYQENSLDRYIKLQFCQMSRAGPIYPFSITPEDIAEVGIQMGKLNLYCS
jgi:hypothetical protein